MICKELQSTSFLEFPLEKDISQQTYVNNDKNIQYLCKTIEIDRNSLDQSFIYHDTQCEYLLLKSITEDAKHRNSFIHIPSTSIYNRYSNIIPYKHNAVPINPSISLENEPSNYINASFLSFPNKIKFISAQNPLENTINSFWLMIIYHKISFVILFSYTFEESSDKFIPYWPTQKNEPINIKDPSSGKEFIIKINSHLSIVEKFVEMREFDVYDSDTNEICLKIKHYHLNCWEDHALPLQQISFQVCDDLILKMDEEINQGYSNPFLVHCSDGVGRSGTFIALFIIIKCLMMQKKDKVENPKFNVFNVVRKLREERYSMVNNASMYKYIYDFSKKWIEMFYNI